VGSPGSGTAWSALLTGIASVAILPLAVYLTRFSEEYELLHAGFAVPVAAVLSLVAIRLARRARRLGAVSLGRESRARVSRAGLVLGTLGLCMAASAAVALAVYGLLEYAGTRS
jgi:hypothetical protein